MAKIAVVLLADNESHGDMGRVANALELAKESKEQGDDVRLVFDGAGTRWVGPLSSSDHMLNPVYEAVKNTVAGACAFCANAFDVKDEVQNAGVKLLQEYEGHPSLRSLIAAGFSVVTF